MKRNQTQVNTDNPASAKEASDQSCDLLSLKRDFMFKRVFGVESNADILANFLSAILKIPIEDLERIEILESAIRREYGQDKASFLDLSLRIKDGTQIIVEIQVVNVGDFVNRATYYEAKRFSEQIVKGERYSALKAVIGVNIVDFDLFERERYHSVYVYKEKIDNETLHELTRIDFLELRKAQRKIDENGGIITDRELAWLALINAKTKEKAQMLAQKEPTLKRAVAEVIRLSGDEAVRAEYNAKEKAETDWLASIKYSKDEGIAIGEERGIAIGEERGRMAEKLKTARSLKSLGSAPDFIAKATGLSIEEIEKL
jgi:predicted transposase/invertase (TIGR01784 family)